MKFYQRCLIIRLDGELDHHNAIRIREEADKLIDRNHIKHIIFDFSSAGFMDSCGHRCDYGKISKGHLYWGKNSSGQC